MASKRAKTPLRKTVGEPMVRQTCMITREMLNRLWGAAQNEDSNFSYEVREAIGRALKIPQKRRHGG